MEDSWSWTRFISATFDIVEAHSGGRRGCSCKVQRECNDAECFGRAHLMIFDVIAMKTRFSRGVRCHSIHSVQAKCNVSWGYVFCIGLGDSCRVGHDVTIRTAEGVVDSNSTLLRFWNHAWRLRFTPAQSESHRQQFRLPTYLVLSINRYQKVRNNVGLDLTYDVVWQWPQYGPGTRRLVLPAILINRMSCAQTIVFEPFLRAELPSLKGAWLQKAVVSQGFWAPGNESIRRSGCTSILISFRLSQTSRMVSMTLASTYSVTPPFPTSYLRIM